MDPARKRRVASGVAKYLVNPIVRPLAARGLAPGVSLLETTGRKSGEPRRTPVGDGLRGNEFWIVAEHGLGAAYVKNIQADPKVRIRIRGRWRAGVATVLPDDDWRERIRWLKRPLNDSVVRVMASEPAVIRVDLESGA